MYWLPYHSFLLESPYSKEEIAEHVKQMALASDKRHLYSDYFFPTKTTFFNNRFTLIENIPTLLLFKPSWQISVSYHSSQKQWKNQYKVTLGYSTSNWFLFSILLLFTAYPAFQYQKAELLLLVGLFFLPILLYFNWKGPKMKKYILQVLNARACSF
jgi:hypothetical protein